jgi:hypothetical protein
MPCYVYGQVTGLNRAACVGEGMGAEWVDEPSIMSQPPIGTSYQGGPLQDPQKLNLMNNLSGPIGASYSGGPLQDPQKLNLMNNLNGPIGASYSGGPLQDPQKLNLMNNLNGPIGASYSGGPLQDPQKLVRPIGTSYQGGPLQDPQKFASMWDDTDDFGNPLTSDAQGRFNFEELRDRAVDKFNVQPYNRPFNGEATRTNTSQPRMIQTENGLRPMTEQEMVKDNQYNVGQKIGSIFGQDDASIVRSKTNQAPVTDKYNLADWHKLNLMNSFDGPDSTIGTSYSGGLLQDPNKFDSALIDRANMNVYKGPMTDRWAAKPGDYRIGRSYSMGEGDWRDPVGGTEYNYTDTDFAGNPLDTDFEGNVPSEADRAKIREMRKGTGTGNIYPGDSDTLFDRKTVESAVTDSTVTGTSGENMDDGTGSASTEGEGKGSGEGEGKGNTTPPAVVIKKIATGEVKGKDADNLWGKIQSKGFWSTPIEGGAGGWDNRLFRLGEMMAYMGTPLSKRGDSPTKRWTTTAKDSSVATKAANTAQAKMQKQKMDYLMKMATVNPKYLATAIQEFLPKGLDDTWFFGLKPSEKEGLAMDIALRAQQAMQRAASEGKQLPYEVAMQIAAKKLVEQRKKKKAEAN